ncbi:MAG TPA: ABC transporter substrate-binding protein [Crenotrichaceae bacterium]|nr:ABC transporter substrate-binding protein [Crenotrichaceae bacterium]
MKRLSIRLLTLFLLFLHFFTVHASEPFQIKIGVVAFGTLQWELAVIQQFELDKQENLQLRLITLANPQAGKIALHAGTVDIGVADWFWVSNQRTNHHSPLTFAPYSATAGALLVAANSPINTIKQLAGKRIGIAGGEIDKNWLLLQTLAAKQDVNLNETVDKVFGAPPILNQQLLQNRLDALLTYWHYAARLESNGYKRLLDGAQMLSMLGIKQKIPTLGYVFSDQWAHHHREAVLRFLRISQQAKNLICTSEQAWETVLPLTRSEDKQTQTVIRKRYCEGRIQHWEAADKLAASTIYSMITASHPNLFPKQSSTLAAGTFWDYTLSNSTTTKHPTILTK